MTETIRIEALTLETLPGANAQANLFLGSTGKAACGICPCGWSVCLMSDDEFGDPYRKHPDKLSTTAVAIRNDNGKVVGMLQMSVYGQPRDTFLKLLHSLEPGEAYIEQVCVDPETRGQGVGTRLLKWSEETARAKDATRLSLGVVAGNPADRLYQRFGFEEVNHGGCSKYCDSLKIFCFFGCPHGKCGGKNMEKSLAPKSTTTMERE